MSHSNRPHVRDSCFQKITGGSRGKNLPENAGDVGLIPGLGCSPGGGHGNPLMYSCLEKPMDRGAWQATAYRIAESGMTEVTAQQYIGQYMYK